MLTSYCIGHLESASLSPAPTANQIFRRIPIVNNKPSQPNLESLCEYFKKLIYFCQKIVCKFGRRSSYSAIQRTQIVLSGKMSCDALVAYNAQSSHTQEKGRKKSGIGFLVAHRIAATHYTLRATHNKAIFIN